MNEDPSRELDRQLDRLRQVDTAQAAERIRRDLDRYAQRGNREVVAALVGAFVAALAAVHFTLQGDPFGYLVLGATAIVMLVVALGSARRTAALGQLRSGSSMLASWRKELARQIRHARYSLLEAGAFVALTILVVVRHGAPGYKPMIFIAVSAGVVAFALYQNLVVVPALKRERAIVDAHE